MGRALRYLILLSLAPAAAAAQSPITGTWVTNAFGGAPNLIDLEVNGSTVIGAISRNQETFAIHDGRVAGDSVTFRVTVAWGGHRAVDFTGTLDDDVLSFTRSVQVLPGPVTSGGQGILRGEGPMEFEAKRSDTGGTTIPRGLLGNWKLNYQRSTYDPGPAPQPMLAQAMTIVAHPGGWFTTATAGVNPNGAPFYSLAALKTDGREYPVHNADVTANLLISGTNSPLTVEARRIDERTVELTNKTNGTVTSLSRIEVSPDGNTLTSTNTGTTAAGVSVTNTVVWERLFSASPDQATW